MWCWINAEPKGCIQSYEGLGPTTCTRGDNAYIYRLAIYYAPIWTCIIFAAVSMIIIYNSIRAQEAIEEKFYAEHAQRFDLDGRGRMRNKKQKEVARQAYLYIGGFLMVWTIPTVNRILQFFDMRFFPLVLLHSIFSPLQGFVNFLVYMRPRLIQHIEQHKKTVMGDGEVKSSTLRAIGAFFFFVEKRKHAEKSKDRDTREVTEDNRAISQDQDQREGNEGETETEAAEDYGA